MVHSPVQHPWVVRQKLKMLKDAASGQHRHNHDLNDRINETFPGLYGTICSSEL